MNCRHFFSAGVIARFDYTFLCTSNTHYIDYVQCLCSVLVIASLLSFSLIIITIIYTSSVMTSEAVKF